MTLRSTERLHGSHGFRLIERDGGGPAAGSSAPRLPNAGERIVMKTIAGPPAPDEAREQVS